MINTSLLLLLAVLQPSSASQQTGSRVPVAPTATDAEPIRFGGGVPRDSMILGETINAPPGYTATGWSLNVSTGTAPCTTLAGMPSQRIEAHAVEANGKVYVLGGRIVQGGAAVATVEEYDPLTDSWRTMQAAMPTPRVSHATVAVNGRIFVLGGLPGPLFNQVTGSVDEYDPVMDRWYSRAPIPTPREAPVVAVLGETIYVLGGIGASITALASVEAYNTTTGTWQVKAPMRTPSAYFSATSMGGKVYAFLGSLDEYDPETDAWTLRNWAAANSAWVTSWGNRMFFVSGASVQEYDITTTVNAERGRFTTPRTGAALVRLEGKILMLGGALPPGAPNVSEQFDLASSRMLYVHRKN